MTDELKEFLSRKDIKESLVEGNLRYCFQQLEEKDNKDKLCLSSELNQVLIDSGTDPFSYIDRIYNFQYWHNENLKSIVIPNNITSIGHESFRFCDNLTSVNIPSSVKSIGTWAFGWCTELTDIDIPDSVRIIGEDAFFGCVGLTNVTIPQRFKNDIEMIFGNLDTVEDINFTFI